MSSDRSAPYFDVRLGAAARTEDLLARMTIEEKLAQLGAVWANDVVTADRFDAERAARVLAHGAGQVTRIGATTVLGPEAVAGVVADLQAYLREHTRLGIPSIVHEESCAGLVAKGATQFPQAIGLASTFDPELVREMADVIREQMLAVGARQTLAPVLDIARDPRWGRAEETFGEDPYLAARMGVAYVRGIQGESLARGVVATGKHFIGYSAPEGGRNWGVVSQPRRDLLERFLPPFAAAIREAGLASIMNGYHELDGVPCGASRELLTDLLRGVLGFDGVVVADYYTVACLCTFHRIADGHAEAAARALEAGLDVELPARECFAAPLLDAIARGRVSESLVDTAVGRVLRQKFELGLFDEVALDRRAAARVYDTPPQRALARTLAAQSMVLLHNDRGVLPLSRTLRRIAVIGPNADSIRNLQGDYSYPAHAEITFGPMLEPGRAPRHGVSALLAPGIAQGPTNLMAHFTPHVSVLDGVRAAVAPDTEVRFAPGCEVTGDDRSGLGPAEALAGTADAAIVVVGGRSGLLRDCTSGEGLDATRLELTGVQAELVRRVAGTGTPTVVVVVSGRCHVLSDVAPHAGALLYAWLPGEEGGHAVADVVFGAVNPAGRLPVSLLRATGQVPLYYNHKPSGAVSMFHGNYLDAEVTPLYPFGHGLSYTRFEYADLSLPARVREGDALDVRFVVTNVGERAGDEVVQLYLRDRVASMTRPVKELKGFARIHLAPGESAEVRMQVPQAQLAFYDLAMRLVVEPGEIVVMVGASSEDVRLEGTLQLVGATREVPRTAAEPTRVEIVKRPARA